MLTGACDWNSVCSNDTICFQNHTGCPVSGAYRLASAGTPCKDCSEGSGEGDDLKRSYNAIVLALLVVVVATVFLGAFFLYCNKRTQAQRYRILF